MRRGQVKVTIAVRQVAVAIMVEEGPAPVPQVFAVYSHLCRDCMH